MPPDQLAQIPVALSVVDEQIHIHRLAELPVAQRDRRANTKRRWCSSRNIARCRCLLQCRDQLALLRLQRLQIHSSALPGVEGGRFRRAE